MKMRFLLFLLCSFFLTPQLVLADLQKPEEAIAAFQSFWTKTPSWQPIRDVNMQHLNDLVKSGLVVAHKDSRDSFMKIPQNEVVYGKLKDLKKKAKYWRVFYDGRLSNGMGACVDAATSQVVLIFIVPEG